MKKNEAESIAIIKNCNMSHITEDVEKGISLTGGLKLNPADVVVIKPNLCAIKGCETGATTDPRVVEGIIRCLQEKFGINNIYIVESDGGQVLADMAFKLLGYERLAKKTNAKLLNLSKSPFSMKTFPNNVFLKKIRVPAIIESAKCFISVPKIKTHMACLITATLKNQYGCNPFPRKPIYHKRLDDAIVDLNFAFKPNLIVVDGIVAMEGNGPVDGMPLRMNTLIVGRDPVAVDHLVTKIMGINPRKVNHLMKAEKRGLGSTIYETVGISPKSVERKFRTEPPRWHNLYGLFYA